MYYLKPFSICLLLLVGLSQISAVQISCSSDNDCSSGQGVCTSIGSSSYCSCLSGFGGEDCSIRPDGACTFGDVDSVTSTLQTAASLNYLYPNLTLTVTANLEESKFAFPALNDTANVVPYSEELSIIFGNGSFTECDFPNNNVDWRDLAASSSDCTDKYSLSLAFTDAKTKCGFADDNGNRIFEQVINIKRKYQLETLRGQSITRVDTSVKTLRVIFPKEVSVSTSNVQVVGSPSVLAAITLIDFDPASTPEKWTVQTTTSIQSPFKLVNPQVISTTGSIQSDNRFSSSSEAISIISGCGTNNEDCFQRLSLDFVSGNAPDACNGLTGSITVRMNVTCSEGTGSDCPLLGDETVQVTLNLATSDACPVTEQITFSVTTLDSYSDSGVSTPRTSFITDQIAYFGANVQSSDALITARTVKAGSVCFQIGNSTCQTVAYAVHSATNGKEPIFSVDFSDPANSAVFGFLDAVDASSQNFNVHATIQVDFSGVSKKSGYKSLKSTGKEVQLATNVKIEKGILDSGAVATLPNMIMLVAIFLCTLLL